MPKLITGLPLLCQSLSPFISYYINAYIRSPPLWLNISQVFHCYVNTYVTYPRSIPFMSKLNPWFPLLCHIYPGFQCYAKHYSNVLPIKSSSTIITTRIQALTLPLLCQHFYPRCCQNYSQNMVSSSLSPTLILGFLLLCQNLSLVFTFFPTLIPDLPH